MRHRDARQACSAFGNGPRVPISACSRTDNILVALGGTTVSKGKLAAIIDGEVRGVAVASTESNLQVFAGPWAGANPFFLVVYANAADADAGTGAGYAGGTGAPFPRM